MKEERAPSGSVRPFTDRHHDELGAPLSTSRPGRGTIPTATTPLIGREKELDEVRELLLRPDVRLVSLTGPGGVGKTSLAIEVTKDLSMLFEDGIFFVSLAPVGDATLVMPTIAGTLGVREEVSGPLFDRLSSMAEKSGVRLRPAKRSLFELVRQHLGEMQVLLVLDNFEHVMAAASGVAELLASCGKLKILVTSRARLELRGEYEFQVPTLSLPELKHATSVDTLMEYAAVALFVRQALLARPDFTITTENSRAVAEICLRVDGLPLALELAAARIRVLSAQALLNRLQSRLKLLTEGPRDLPARQKTLRNTIAWSYDLLAPGEKTLFNRLGIFAGGCTLEAAEKVCTWKQDLGMEIVDGLQSLIDKSLVRRCENDGEGRFEMLSTIREFALDSLRGRGETEETSRVHARFFTDLARRAEPELRGPNQVEWLDLLEHDHDNLRAALGWLMESRDDGAALQMAGALWSFWLMKGYLSEGRERLEAVLDRSPARTLARATALRGAGVIAAHQGDHGASRAFQEESMKVCRELGDKQGVSFSLNALGGVAYDQGDYDTARPLFEQSLAIKRELHDELGIAKSLGNLGSVAHQQGNYSAAQSLYEQSLAIKREIGDKMGMSVSLNDLGKIAFDRQGYAAARSLFERSLSIKRELGEKYGIALCLEGLAAVASAEGSLEQAARLFGAAEALRENIRAPLLPADRIRYDRDLGATRGRMREELFRVAWMEGRSMTLDQAIAYALGDER